MAQKFECYRQTPRDTRRTWRCYNLDFRKLSFHALCYLIYRTVRLFVGPSVCLSVSSVAPADWMSRNVTSYIGRPPNHRRLQFHNISDNKMADTRVSKSVATQASLTWGKSITVYGPWNIIHCSQFSCGMYNLYSICAVNVLWCCAAEHVAAGSVQLL